MQSLAARRLQKPLKLEAIEQRARELARMAQCRPGQCRIGIEVERDPIGPIHSRKARSPRMEFKHAVLHDADDIFKRLQMQVRRRVGLPSADPPEIAGMFLEEAIGEVAPGTFDHRQRTVADFGQQPSGDGLVVTHDVKLRDAVAFTDDAIGVADRDAGDVGLFDACLRGAHSPARRGAFG